MQYADRSLITNDIDHTCQGNVQFESDGESVQIQGLEAVSHISELIGTDPDSVSKSLLYRTVATGGGEVIEKGHSEQDACFGRDAFAKVRFPRLIFALDKTT